MCMRSRQHFLMSVLTVLPFLLVLFFTGTELYLLLLFLAAVILGAMLPDADADGTPALYHKAKWLYYTLRWFVIKPVVIFFRLFVRSKHDVEDLHRGIMHAPIGILISSIFVCKILILILYLLGALSWLIVGIFFVGVFIGQIMHLLEDSLTPGGINWAFPFGDAKLSGRIYTHDLGKSAKRHDIRPFFFSTILLSINLGVIFLYSVELSKQIPFIYVLIPLAILLLLAWIFIFAIAKTESELWKLG